MLFIGSVSQPYAQTNYQRAPMLYQKIITGQKKFEDLSQHEKMLVILVDQSISASDENIGDYGFSLRDIEKKCEVYKYSDSYGDVECQGSSLRIIENKCEAYFPDPQNGGLECQGSDFKVVERKCSVNMYSESYGEIDC